MKRLVKGGIQSEVQVFCKSITHICLADMLSLLVFKTQAAQIVL